ncbi:MAG: aminodeoxychorismate/anthranilate synthase component II [Candidatus Eremiobacteraeota bacterium]|nr:aminodeoxychorismate/anthranilate synthase component II [Candidatus Eremiobacteraeota bacterium]
MSTRLLFIDNIDSFTYNVVHLLAAAGAISHVIENDDPRLRPEILDDFDALVVGPGPGRPADYPAMLSVLRSAIERKMPVLGVCLGLQAIGEVLGAKVVHAPRLMHGKVSAIAHDGSGLFDGIPSPLRATRYHSLCLEAASLPAELRVVATSEDGAVQAIAHRSLPVAALQFHPESILSERGEDLIRNFLKSADSKG